MDWTTGLDYWTGLLDWRTIPIKPFLLALQVSEILKYSKIHLIGLWLIEISRNGMIINSELLQYMHTCMHAYILYTCIYMYMYIRIYMLYIRTYMHMYNMYNVYMYIHYT